MPVRSPRLDDRAFPDLVAEALARIPAHTPEYTNPVPGDPGVTLIELFAWLTDTLLYRVNLVPERQRLEFLRTVGVSLRGARPARGLISLTYGDLESPSSPVAVESLRPWCVVKGAGPAEFETRRVVQVVPVSAIAYHKRKLRAHEADNVATLLPELAELYELGGKAPRPYVTTPAFPQDQAIPVGLDVASEAVDRSLWLAVLAGTAGKVEAARTALGRDAQGQQRVLSIGVVPVPAADSGEQSEAGLEDLTLGAGTARPIPVSWEISTGRTTARGPVFHELEVLRDGSSGLTRSGVVELVLPDAAHIGRPENDVRTTIDAGVGARPPRLDDDALNDRVVTWIRLRPHDGVDRLSVAWLGINAVEVDQRRTISDIVLGASTGAPEQRFPLPAGSVERESFALQVEEEGRGWVDWQLVEHLGLAGREQAVYALDDDEGFIEFGNGVRGRIPERQRRVRVHFMRAGGGAAGNLPARSLSAISARRLSDGAAPQSPIVALQATPSYGGVAAETLEEGERRIQDVLRHRYRAVTAEDTVAIAASTPGERLGRVEVLKGFKPQQRRTEVPGAVSVFVLPRVDGFMPPNPRPSRHTIEAVYDWLSPRVPLATELYVIGCEYKPIGVGVGIELREGFEREPTLQAVRAALRSMLWPLSPGGPFEDASGWPRGRAVRERELAVAIARVPGVDEVFGVKLFTQGASPDEWELVPPSADGSAEITLTAWQLPELLGLVVSEGPAPDTLEVPAQLGSGDIPVPVVPEVC